MSAFSNRRAGRMIDRNHCANMRELHFRIACWLAERERTADELRATWCLSRATAYRFLQDWRAARGVL